MSYLLRLLGRVEIFGGAFRSDKRGNVAIVFAFASLAVVIGVGAGIDLARAYSARQKLSEVSALTCQYSTRPSVTASMTGGSTGFSTYVGAVNTYAAAALTQQKWIGTAPTASNGTYFTATVPSGTSTTPTSPATEIQANINTYFMSIVGVSSIPVRAKVSCQSISTVSTIVTSPLVVQEGFETTCATFCYTKSNGTTGYSTTPTSTVPSSTAYTGVSGNSWYIMGYCLETDVVGAISTTVPEGTHSAELDCENGSNSKGNSSISTKFTLTAGTYELRYYYRERIPNSTYAPAYVCGTQYNPDINWVSNSTNQINVYFDLATTLPTHSTTDGTQTLGGSNLIDTCVNSTNWIQRSVVLTVTTAGTYWLSFAADGTSDSFGGQIDDIRLCQGLCSGTPADAFPSTWLTSSTLLSDTFSASNAFGWYVYTKSTSVYISPMCKTYLICSTVSRSVSDNVMLDPGFYQLSYQYISLATASPVPTTQCNQTPTSTDVATYRSTTVTGTNTSNSTTYSTKADLDFLGIFLSFPNQTFSPSIGATISATNPLIDSCLYSASVVTRKIAFQVTKPGYYTLYYYAGGTATTPYEGGAIANPTITALGSPYTMTTSSYCPSVPVPDPQISTTVSYTGFSFVIPDPFVRGASATTSCAPT